MQKEAGSWGVQGYSYVQIDHLLLQSPWQIPDIFNMQNQLAAA